MRGVNSKALNSLEGVVILHRLHMLAWSLLQRLQSIAGPTVIENSPSRCVALQLFHRKPHWCASRQEASTQTTFYQGSFRNETLQHPFASNSCTTLRVPHMSMQLACAGR